MRSRAFGFVVGLLGVLVLALAPRAAGAHCDILGVPVVAAARVALQKGDVTPVLKWVKEEHEVEIRSAFARALVVQAKGPEARELAEMYFFETLVRLHRAGEGAPYTGLTPAGTDLGPAASGADQALASGSVEGLVKLVSGDVATGIRERFARASETRKHMDESVTSGRAYVAAYVEYVHFVERLHSDATAGATHHGEAVVSSADHHGK
jgi:hypothetical protein